MIVQITGKPTEDNADIGVRLACSAEVARELGSDHTVPTTTKRSDNSEVGVAAGNSQAGRCHRDLGGGGRDGGVHGRGLQDTQTAKVAIRVAEFEMNIYMRCSGGMWPLFLTVTVRSTLHRKSYMYLLQYQLPMYHLTLIRPRLSPNNHHLA
jgi:hypothetical protein